MHDSVDAIDPTHSEGICGVVIEARDACTCCVKAESGSWGGGTPKPQESTATFAAVKTETGALCFVRRGLTV